MPTRKVTAKKPAAKSKAASARKMPAKTVRKTTVRRKKAATPQSFKVYKQEKPFFSFKPDIQTIYWGILAAAVLSLGLWILSIHDQVQYLYDEIDRTVEANQELDEANYRMLQEKNSAE